LVVGVDGGGHIEPPQFHECDAVRFIRLDVDMAGANDAQEARDLIIDAVQEQADAQPSHALLLRVELVGASPAAAEIRAGFESIQHDTVDESAQILGDGAVIKMRNSCRPAINLEVERSRDTLLGSVLRRLDADQREGLTDETRAAVEALLVERLAVGS
jgi:hypothetical protein